MHRRHAEPVSPGVPPHGHAHGHHRRPCRTTVVALLLGFALGAGVVAFVLPPAPAAPASAAAHHTAPVSSPAAVKLTDPGSFNQRPRRGSQFVSSETLLESPWLKVESHTVRKLRTDRRRGHRRSPDTDEEPAAAVYSGEVIKDWRWVDIPNHMNVMPTVSVATAAALLRAAREANATREAAGFGYQDPLDDLAATPGAAAVVAAFEHQRPAGDDGAGSGGHHAVPLRERELFVLFRQRKYGFSGVSWAPVGGLTEGGEETRLAAVRELSEELGLRPALAAHQPPGSAAAGPDAMQLHHLGDFVVDANRGCGICGVFIARRCEKERGTTNGHQARAAAADLEPHDAWLVTLDDIRGIAMARASGRPQRVLELKWFSTMSSTVMFFTTGPGRGHAA